VIKDQQHDEELQLLQPWQLLAAAAAAAAAVKDADADVVLLL